MKVFSFLLTCNLVLASSVLLLLVAAPLTKRLAAGSRLRLHYAILTFGLVMSAAVMFKSGGEVFKPVVKVWSSSGEAKIKTTASSKGLLQVHQQNLPLPADYFFLFTFGLGAGATLAGLLYLFVGQRQLAKFLQRAYQIRSLGRVRVLISEEIKVPFSYRTLKYAYVVIPQYLITNQSSLRLTVAHELQHHRQRDTHWAYGLLLTRALCFLNPFVHFWIHWIGELQEFACDEALVGRHRQAKQAYARCLIEVAETAGFQGSVPVGATGMILLNHGNLLNRRIQVMFKEKQTHETKRFVGLGSFVLIASLITVTAFAAKGLVQDRRVTFAQAQQLAALSTTKDSSLPVVVNEEVLRHLNYFIGTPQGREKMRNALRRMEPYRAMITGKIAEYNLPVELMAIPLIESGYQNLEERNSVGWGAGLWMFIASTARAYGLTVYGNVDQRLNETLLTDAAMRYLLANRLRFKDWELSILSYISGETAVQKAIDETGSRDAWTLVRQSSLTREGKDYLPKLMAAIIVMNNPSSVD